jgi:hypothetical protein
MIAARSRFGPGSSWFGKRKLRPEADAFAKYDKWIGVHGVAAVDRHAVIPEVIA